MARTVKVVGIGGSARPGSTAERALRITLAEAERLGAHVSLISGADLAMPLYDPREGANSPQAQRLLAEVAAADGLVLASPAYHGTVSGLVKNALDHVEELRGGDHPYFTGRAVGCLAVGMGWQGAVNTLTALRGVVHALRGWPTPLGVAVNTESTGFGPDGTCTDDRVTAQLAAMAGQVVDFAHRSPAARELTPVT
ncbi:NAD(P)H-dependent oxidoreductase [Streptomyces sp. SL13]|uniref:NAD(P)H-dependent oxidoreductase n=1 Tax=Streptantibioticus silvisoli TaxID=2705255 RepID=A0AA90KH85_9ACTN|nr:NAD(P)H-dependent oxidoreductase [Streptantibioticus silvisoli]MDI5964890.1 NAD(P)H-dependent oxidoreductase [Streptantibioticus silvisoli]MDI5971114.1 NAD(P)H-dependent oxidoreductase [Streptantibioticus silvisoli]